MHKEGEVVETEETMPFRTEPWDLNTEITAGNQQKGAKKTRKTAKVMGFNNEILNY
jgi:hypothetical protein